MNKPLVSNFISLFILQGANYILPLITVPYLFRVLGVEKYGLINFSASFIQYFVVLTDFGYNLSATKLIAENRDKEELRDRIFNNVMLSKLLLLIIGFVITLAIVLSFEKFSGDKTIYIITYGLVVGSVLFPIWFFQGMEKMKYITLITISTRILAIVPIFFLVRSDADYLWVPTLNSIGVIVAGLISLRIVRRKFNVSLFYTSWKEIIDSLKESSGFFLSRVSVSIYTISNTFVLGLVLGNIAVGYYVAAEKVFLALQNAYTPLNNAIYPFIAKTKNVLLFKKIFIYTVIINVVLISSVYLGADHVMSLLYRSISIDSITVLRILLIACLFIVPSILLGYPFLAALGYSKYTNTTVVLASIVHLVGLTTLYTLDALNIFTVASMVILTELVVLSLRVAGVVKNKLLFIK